MRIFEQSKTHRAPAIRLINLVDVLFILLIFFIATTTFRVATPAAVKLALPEAKTAEQLGRETVEQLVITVAPDETIYLDARAISLDALEGELRAAKGKNPAVKVQLSADRSVSYGTVIAIVDAARAAEIRDLTAFTEKAGERLQR